MFLGKDKKDMATLIVGLSAPESKSDFSMDEEYAKDLMAAFRRGDAKEAANIFCAWHTYKHDSEDYDEDEMEDSTEMEASKEPKGKDY